MPTPHPATTCVMMLSGCWIGASGVACTDVVTATAKTAKAINLIIRTSHVFRRDFLKAMDSRSSWLSKL
jgi:hypothetical protein